MRLESLPGSVLDHKYQIDRQLGKGAMGAVFQATHLGTMRTVALKVIVPKLAAEAEFSQRFKREAEAAGRLYHPNVVNVTDFGVTRVEDADLAYMVMEYLDGQTLSAYLKSEPRPTFNFILDIVDQTALALDAAHRAGIVHRDLKPSNIWLEPNHRGGFNVKVLDFGIAKVSNSSAAAQTMPASNEAETIIMASAPGEPDEQEMPTLLTTPSHLRTTVGTLLGTPAYMAPEQCQGLEVDYRADIYSLATIVYEMLCSRLPFQAEDYKQLVRMQVNDAPQPPSERDSSVPVELSSAVLAGLAKKPADRPRSARAYASLLRSVADDENNIIRKSKDVFHTHTNCLFPILFGCVALVAALGAPFWFAAHLLYLAKTSSAPALLFSLEMIFFALVVLGSQAFKAGCFLVLQDAAKKGQFVPRPGPVLATVIRGLPAIFRTQCLALLAWKPKAFREYLLWPVVWAGEGLSGKAALDRSRQLSHSLSDSSLLALAVRQITPASMGVLLFPAIIALTSGRGGLQVVTREELAGSGFGLFCLIYPLIFMLFYVNYSAAATFLYWAALESRDEGGDVTLPSAGRNDKRGNARRIRPATLIWAAIPLVLGAILLDKITVTNNETVLEDALVDGRRTAIEKALNGGLSADYRTSNDETPLFEAVRTGDAKLVAALTARGANMNARSRSGSTPLIQAAVYDRAGQAQLLVGLGASVNAANNDGRTALMVAAMRGNLPLVRFLLANGADPKRVDSHGKNALTYAREEGYAEIVALLHG